ncbi:hypothetical protein CDAR_177401 [Caerostris darwini]|uniref:Uncharacterized protein n=1 Tax=Caerostris darwini TaxID=1538125 RepID=A0AAV4P701_9ARAC|nr:hypothetical protein CDAR_177401 [Caerostris darwini]
MFYALAAKHTLEKHKSGPVAEKRSINPRHRGTNVFGDMECHICRRRTCRTSNVLSLSPARKETINGTAFMSWMALAWSRLLFTSNFWGWMWKIYEVQHQK